MAAFPSITPTSVSLIAVNPTRISTSLNGIQQTEAVAGSYFRMVATFNGLNKAEIRQIKSHMMAQGGPLTSFAFTLPDYLGDSTGAYASTITLTAGLGVGATSATVNSTGSTFPSLKAGDLIQFASHTKLYTLTSDVNSPGTTLAFYPALRKAATGGTSVAHKNLTITVRYASDNQEFGIGTDELSDISIEFIEVLT